MHSLEYKRQRVRRLLFVVAIGLSVFFHRSVWLKAQEPQLLGKEFRHVALNLPDAARSMSELTGDASTQTQGALDSLGIGTAGTRVDALSGRFETLLPSYPLVTPRSSEGQTQSLRAEEARVAFTTFLSTFREELSVDVDEVGTVRATVHGDGTVIQLYVPRLVRGIPVLGSHITGVINNGNLVLFGLHRWGDVELSLEATVSASDASDIALTHMAPYQFGDTWGRNELVLVPTVEGDGYGHRLAWQLRPAVAGELVSFEFLIDAHTGALLSAKDTNVYSEAKGGVLPVTNDGVSPDGVEQPHWPMPFLNVTTSDGVLTTDTGGNLAVSGSMTSELAGPFVRMKDNCGTISLTQTDGLDFGVSGGTDCTTPGFGGAGNTHASRTGFYELNRMKEMARGWLPSSGWLQQQLTANMNINNSCNAFWNGSTVNFYRSGGGCANTGEIAGVFDHEWGHGMDHNDANPSISSPSGEGIADIYTALRLNDSCIGRNFLPAVCGGNGDPCLTCTGVRDIDYEKRQSGKPHNYTWSNANCSGSVHCVGAVYSEAVWSLWKRNLQSAPYNYDNNTAHEIVNRLTFIGAGNVGTWFSGGPPFGGCSSSGGYLNYLAVDDDDGDLSNGTPHMTAIFNAFNAQEIACEAPVVQDSVAASTPSTAPSVSTAAGHQRIDLTWGEVSGAANYHVFRAEGVFGCNFGKVKIGETVGTSFNDTGLQNGRDYSYVVLPVGATDSNPGPASACATDQPVGQPDFTLACTPSSLLIAQGAASTTTCTATSVFGYEGTVGLSCSGEPAGIGCSFTPSSVSLPAGGSVGSTVTLTADRAQPSGTFTFNAVSADGSKTRTAGISAQIIPAGSNGPQVALYDSSLGTPKCGVVGSSCDSGVLIDGRNGKGPEPNWPNTLDFCSDGTAGTYHHDESIDRIVISTLDGGNFTEGNTVKIDTTVYAWSTGASDTLDLYYTADATNPEWYFIGSFVPGAGVQILSAQYTLPAWGTQAVRARFRYRGSVSSCFTGSYDDHDDLVFTVAPASVLPVVSAVTPATGAIVGGTPVTIGGSSFAAGANVSIGGVTATNVTVVDSTMITAVTGVHAAGAVDVVVTNPDTQTGTLVAGFTYVAAPVVSATTPATGASAGGTQITIVGNSFAAGVSVSIGGVAATNVTVVDSTTITAVTGAHAAGTVDVVVTNPDTQTGTLVAGFTYVAAPVVSATTPATGASAGGTQVTVVGNSFAAGANVSFGGVAATNVTVVDSTTITAVTGARAAGTVDVVVTNPDTQTGTLVAGFTYVATPVVSATAPATGASAGGTEVTVAGSSFAAGANVSFGGVAATNVTVVDSTTITAVTGARAAGTVDVVVTNPDTQTGTLVAGFTYVNDKLRLLEVMAGANGDATVQFIVVEQLRDGENLWGPQAGETQSRAQLLFFDGAGRETGRFNFPTDPPTGGTLKTLVATENFAALAGAPAPDVIIPPLLSPMSGKVCLQANPANAVFQIKTCLAYGDIAGDTAGGGPPAASLPIVDTVSLRRVNSTGKNDDFQLADQPTPTNIAGDSVIIPVAPLIAQGGMLFERETFAGNGRTCATCHLQSAGFRLPPEEVTSRFARRASTYEPLFIAETVPSSFDPGFDFNLNTLVVTGDVPSPSDAPCTGELRGVITSGSAGRAKVLTRISSTTYLVYGGISPTLSGTVTDGVCSATVASVTAGSLGAVADGNQLGLEDPRFMRGRVGRASPLEAAEEPSGDASDPEGRRSVVRGLILENIDGFENAPVFRKSPHLLNLSRTAPFGLSGHIPELLTFPGTAARQHFPRTLARNEAGTAPDFRLPTQDESIALEAFLLAQEFPPGDDPNKFDLERFVVTNAQRRGRNAFFGFAKCSQCHGGTVLGRTTVSIQGKEIGVNASFNTGVVNRSAPSGPQSQSVDEEGSHSSETGSGRRRPQRPANGLPCEPSVGVCGSREFSTPQLLNIRNLGPFFHDGSARTVREVVQFYDTAAFNRSPAGRAIGGINLSRRAVNDITAFLEGLALTIPTLRITGTQVTEGTGAGRQARLRVVLSDPPNAVVQVHWATEEGSATAGRDYVNGEGLLTFARGQQERHISVEVYGDRRVEPDETFVVRLSEAVNAEIIDSSAVAVITDDDDTIPFTDESLEQGMTIRAVHFRELRERVDAQLTWFGQARFEWTHPIVVGGIIHTTDLLELYAAVNQALQAAGESLTEIPRVLSKFTVIGRAHLVELRDAVRLLEGL